eukprot:480719-Hanusia_phi.AAC.1
MHVVLLALPFPSLDQLFLQYSCNAVVRRLYCPAELFAFQLHMRPGFFCVAPAAQAGVVSSPLPQPLVGGGR